jgi:uncharacterized coiled-coil protein SlyX
LSAIDQFKDSQIEMLKETVAEYAVRIDALEITLRERDEAIERLIEKIRNLEGVMSDAVGA